jgi:hypothetical protein
MTKKSIHLILMILFLLLFNLEASDKQDEFAVKKNPITPYTNFGDAIKILNFEKAQTWLDITIKDFPDTEFAISSKYIKVIIDIAHELAYLRIYDTFSKGEANILEFNDLERKRKKEEFQKITNDLKSKLNAYGLKLKEDASRIIDLDKEPESVNLNFSMDVGDWDIDRLRMNISNGDLPTELDKKTYISNEILINFLSVLTKIANLQASKDTINSVNDSINKLEFYYLLGVRLYNIGDAKTKKDIGLIKLAKKCFEKALDVSKENKYSTTRQDALEYLTKIEAKLGLKKEISTKICSECKKTFISDYNFCPYDGKKLEENSKHVQK